MASMNVSYPAVRPRPQGTQEVQLPLGSYGVPDVMLHGLNSGKCVPKGDHPLEYSEKHWHENKVRMDHAMLRNTQGIHMPLKLQMEMNMAGKVNRLPGLISSNLMRDTLSGKDERIEFEDILNRPEESEIMGDTHLLIEKKSGIL